MIEAKNSLEAAQLEYMRKEIEQRAVYRCKPGTSIPGKAPNKTYGWQFYLRRVMFDPRFIMTAASILVDRLPDRHVQIGACEDAGVPLGLAMASILGTPMLSIKKSRKVYGLLNFTEGRALGLPILLVDDLAGSQNTLRNAEKLLTAFGLPVAKQYVTLINKTRGTHDAYLNERQLISLFNCDDFAMSWKEYVEKFGREPDFGAYY